MASSLKMRYVPFASNVELPFWGALASHKVNHDKLDDSARKVLGLYEIRPNDAKESSCHMQIHGNALTSDEVPTGLYRAEGMIKNVNTFEEYKTIDKAGLLQQAGRTIWEAIKDGTIYSCPSLLASFVILSYADLKKYRFSYWFGFPAFLAEPAWELVANEDAEFSQADAKAKGISAMSGLETQALVDSVQTWRYSVDTRQHGFFLAKRVRGLMRSASAASTDGDDQRPKTPKTPTEKLGWTWSVASLSSFETGFFDGTESEDRFFCFADPSNYPKEPCWVLRNLLVLARQRWNLNKVQILCYRDRQSRRDEGRSIIFTLALPASEVSSGVKSVIIPKVVGWERKNEKLVGRVADLTEYMDPSRLADQSVDLNLKLMKWRISPNLNLDKIKDTKCLLLGAGTLGSYVARNLLGWGVREVNFVDNGKVSFSNPVRQPLFKYEDCLNGGKDKASRAASTLKEIYPGVTSKGSVLSVPMAGHSVMDEAKTKREFESLKAMVAESDVIFLLMDTREARWLPTVMGKAAGKIVMNAALGFDSFVVMRHGVKLEGNREGELGCYFCNDVVAPADSMKDQTLDQQCTVTRPGVAAIASALLVELLVSVLQHPLSGAAPASQSTAEDRGDHPLGLIPHQIRGFLSNFQNISISGKSYDCCSACSDKVIDAYKADGWSFVLKVLNEPGYVEELSGLKEVQRAAEAAAADIEWSEEGSIEDEGEGEIV